MERNLIIDAHNLIHRSAHQKSFAKFTTSSGLPSGHFFGLFRMLLSLKKEYTPTQLVIAWDSYPRWKREAFPEYKAQRVKQDTGGINIIEEGETLLGCINSLHLITDGEEADDTVASFCHQQPPLGVQNLVVTTDKDLWQLMPKVKIINSAGLVTAEKVKEEYDVEDPKLIPVIKALYGDASDNLPKVPRLKWDNVVEAVKASKGDIDKFWTANTFDLTEYKDQINKNYLLAKLKTNLKITSTQHTANPDAVLALVKKYECKSLVDKVQDLVR